jgi:hypothetical protein
MLWHDEYLCVRAVVRGQDVRAPLAHVLEVDVLVVFRPRIHGTRDRAPDVLAIKEEVAKEFSLIALLREEGNEPCAKVAVNRECDAAAEGMIRT